MAALRVPRSPWTWLAIASVGLVGLAVLQFTLVQERRLLEDDLEELRARGEPAVLEDLLELTTGGDAGTLERLLGHSKLRKSWREEDLRLETPSGVLEAIAVCRERGTAAEVELLELWSECLEADAEAARLLVEGGRQEFFGGQPRLDSITDCERVALRVALSATAAQREWARATAQGGPVDAHGELERILASSSTPASDLFPRIPVVPYLQGVRILGDGALLAAIEGREEESRRLLELTFRWVGLLRGEEWLVGFVAATASADRALQALEWTLPYLPRDADLSRVEAALAAWDPLASLAAALRAERAYGNHFFDQIRAAGASSLDLDSLSLEGLLFALGSTDVLYVDQRNYLEGMAIVIAECAKPTFDIGRGCEQQITEHLESALCAQVTSLMMPQVSDLHGSALQWGVRRRLAQAALVAHRDGLEAGRAHLQAARDPFSSGPLQARVEEGRRLVLWSVGRDGVDHGAHWIEDWERQRDIAWRYGLHQR